MCGTMDLGSLGSKDRLYDLTEKSMLKSMCDNGCIWMLMDHGIGDIWIGDTQWVGPIVSYKILLEISC